MNHFYVTLILVLATTSLRGTHTIKVPYNDDITPRKVRLEDLEVDIEEKEQRALFTPYQQNRYLYESAQVRPTALAHLYHQQNIPIPLPISTTFSYKAATPNSFNFGVHPFAYNSINNEAGGGEADTDVDLSTTPQQHSSKQQSIYNNNPQVSGFVLVPTFGGSGISDARNYETISATPHPLPPPTTTLAYQQQQTQQHPLLIAPAGVRYLTSNELSDVTTATAPTTLVLLRKPALEYGIPDAPIRPPYSTQQQAASQSNQFAYAPKRSESVGLAASYHATIPYPPSFISITTSRPDDPYAADVPVTGFLRRTPFKPSQPDPVPDFFETRHTKSLLESYIPSWVIAKIVQQRRNLYNRNTLATPYNHRHYKRAADDLKDAVMKKRSVKKSLPEKSEKDEELIMTT